MANDNQIAGTKRLIDAGDWDSFYADLGDSLNMMDSYDRGYMDALDRADDWMDAQPTIDAVPVIRCHECIYGIQCEDDPLCEGDPGDFWYQCVEGAEYDTESGMYHGFTSYHSADFFCANGERRADHERETGRAAG